MFHIKHYYKSKVIHIRFIIPLLLMSWYYISLKNIYIALKKGHNTNDKYKTLHNLE